MNTNIRTLANCQTSRMFRVFRVLHCWIWVKTNPQGLARMISTFARAMSQWRKAESKMSYDDFPYDVFLSHSAEHNAVERPLAERLRADGLKVWFDEWELKPGDPIAKPPGWKPSCPNRAARAGG